MEIEGELHNFVLVVERFLDCGKDQAVRVVNDLMTARAQQFEHVVATELPALSDDLGLSARAREGLEWYVEQLQKMMSGTLHWCRHTGRFKEPERQGSRRRSTSRALAGSAPRRHGLCHC
ncbi:hypothetical protein OV079_51180 [Nannocystis pusilla]|uniref:Uncharacterized protein n=1 Tax=Nannocystis pusilla TaxID=889268 RepID=A0A9X3F1R8_9BACT|nr:hypothetical protein [Nannocystis pusilla]MCY1013755.1 hypothetical protein [Nannocystis pusilla]